MNWFRELWQTKRVPFILITVLTIVVFALPTFVGDLTLFTVAKILILSLFSLSVNLLLGYTGLLSFGQGMFFALGAFGCGKILLVYPNLPIGIIGGVAIAALGAIILGWFSIRHTAIYFAMITLAFSMMMYEFIGRWDFLNNVSRYFGLAHIPRAPIEVPGVLSISMESISSYYHIVVILTGVAIFFFYKLIHSPLGLSFQGARDSESRLAFAGLSVRNTRLVSFVFAGVYAGLAGALFAPLSKTVPPTVTHWSYSAEPIIATLLGGMHTFAGPIVGAVVYYLVKDLISRYTINWMLPLGAVVVALVLGLRGGIVGRIEGWLAQRRRMLSEVGT